MKYMLSWSERPQGSPMEYENAQKRILEVFTQWKAPDNFKIELFVIRVGDWGGYMLLVQLSERQGLISDWPPIRGIFRKATRGDGVRTFAGPY